MAKILVVDDESGIRRVFKDILEHESYKFDEAADGAEAVAKVKQNKYDAIIMDIKMPRMDGMEALEQIQELAPDTPVIMISGHADIELAVQAVRRGAFDFVSKPLDLQRILITLRNALDKSTLITETKVLKRKVSQVKTTLPIIGDSAAIMDIKSQIDTVAPLDVRVLVTGSNGTGKELVAHWIHEKSMRAGKPIVEVNCAAIPSELIESELFGHMKGSFTGAVKDHAGKFEQAHGGTIFLDEIGDMSHTAQAKVLRALQEKRISRVGGDKEIEVDVRVIAATNKDLLKEIERGNFREDLYYRLAVVLIEVPSLNDRKSDIPLLVAHFIQMICNDYGTAPKKISEAALRELDKINWTGNIRELRNVVERLIIFSNPHEIVEADVLRYVTPVSSDSAKAKRNRFKDIFAKFDSESELLSYVSSEYRILHGMKPVAVGDNMEWGGK